jgi:hypothetical protein
MNESLKRELEEIKTELEWLEQESDPEALKFKLLDYLRKRVAELKSTSDLISGLRSAEEAFFDEPENRRDWLIKAGIPESDIEDDDGLRAEIRRLSAQQALRTVLEYLSHHGACPYHYAPFKALEMALADADAGLSNPMLVPAKWRRGSKVCAEDTIKMCEAAAAVTIWKDYAGWSLSAAEKKAAGMIGKDPKELHWFWKNVAKEPNRSEIYQSALAGARSSSASPEDQGYALLKEYLPPTQRKKE